MTERELFDRLMARHAAALCDKAAPYCGGMSNADKEHFLKIALDNAWDYRASFNPPRGSLLKGWMKCLKYAALSRAKWYVSVATLPGVYDHKWVAGCDLGKE